jgi:hypothetical protein
MSIIKKIRVELSDIVKEANLILMVDYLESFIEDVAIKGVDQSVPPFKKKGFVFKVKSVLKNTAKIEVPETISVPKEDWRRSFSQHKEQYAGGSSKSFAVKEYETSVKSIQKADIIFLHHFQGSFDLEVKNAFESTEELEKITMLIAAE